MGKLFSLNYFFTILLFIICGCGGGGGVSDGQFDSTQKEEGGTTRNFIQVLDGNYTLKQVMSTDIGLQAQIALLQTGEVVIADPNFNRISTISNNTAKIVSEEDDINGWGGVTTLPDGRICYSLNSGQLILIDPDSGYRYPFSSITNGASIRALASDEIGNIYAATSHQEVFQFGSNGVPIKLVENLPYDIEWAINDIDVDPNGIIYIAGYNRVVRVMPDRSIEIIADGLNYEPVWVEVAKDGSVYINDAATGLQKYNPIDSQFEDLKPEGLFAFGDILSSANNEIIFYEWTRVYYKYNFTTKVFIPLLSLPGNSQVFAVDFNSTSYFATPSKPPYLYSYIKTLNIDGDIQDFIELKYGQLHSASVDKNGRLCIATNEGFIRLEQDKSITVINTIFETSDPPCCYHWVSIGPDNKWYVLSSNYDDSIVIYSFDDSGEVEFLPIVFDKATFGGAYQVTPGNIDIGDNGRIAIIATAVGSHGEGPFYQRIYIAESDGSNLTEIANLDSKRIGGPVDIAIAPDGDIFVLSVQDTGDNIYRIDHQTHNITEFISCETGHDPASIDVDPSGNVWITTTNGIYIAELN